MENRALHIVSSGQLSGHYPFSSSALDMTPEIFLETIQFPSTMKIRRLWEFWPGNNQFWLDGRIMLGPKSDRIYAIAMWALFVGVTVCYFVNVVPYLWIEMTPALPILTSVLCFNCVVFMVLTATVDPGIIPRKCVFELNQYIPQRFTAAVVTQENMCKKCSTCNIYKPARSHHCNICGNCVEVFDHHCPYLNNCIGRRNYRYFLAFIFNAVLYGLSMVAGLCLFLLYDKNRDKTDHTVMGDDATVIVVIVVLSVLTAGLTLLVTLLCLFHISLCYSGETTKERLKKTEDMKKVGSNCCRQSLSWFNKRQILTLEQVKQASEWTAHT